jgi:hypothetical protein
MARKKPVEPNYAVEDRRTKVARLMVTLDRPTLVNIQNTLGAMGTSVSISTVNRDVQAVRAEWREQRLRDMDDHIEEQLARINSLEQDARSAIAASLAEQRSTERHFRNTDEGMQLSGETHRRARGTGNAGAMRVALDCIRERDRVLGLTQGQGRGMLPDGDGEARVFAFTLKVGDKVLPAKHNEGDVIDLLPAQTQDKREVVWVDEKGTHRKEELSET